MSRYATDKGGEDFKQASQGTHLARCVGIVDIGTHDNDYQGKKGKQNQIILRWELPHETIEIDGQKKPMIVSAFMTNSLSEKANLRKALEAWRSKVFTPDELKGFDLNKIVGTACMVTVVHKNDKAKVSAVTAVPKGMEMPPQVNPSVIFWIDEWNDSVFESLPNYFKTKIMESDEYKAMGRKEPKDNGFENAPGKTFAPDDSDEVPFVRNECGHSERSKIERRLLRGSTR